MISVNFFKEDSSTCESTQDSHEKERNRNTFTEQHIKEHQREESDTGSVIDITTVDGNLQSFTTL